MTGTGTGGDEERDVLALPRDPSPDAVETIEGPGDGRRSSTVRVLVLVALVMVGVVVLVYLAIHGRAKPAPHLDVRAPDSSPVHTQLPASVVVRQHDGARLYSVRGVSNGNSFSTELELTNVGDETVTLAGASAVSLADVLDRPTVRYSAPGAGSTVADTTVLEPGGATLATVVWTAPHCEGSHRGAGGTLTSFALRASAGASPVQVLLDLPYAVLVAPVPTC